MSERECCQKCREAAELRNERAWFSRTMLVCRRCGNKRCPKIVDHRHACTNSNESGQVGAPGVDAVIPPPVEYRTVPAATIATLTHRAEAAEASAALWRERCNAAEARVARADGVASAARTMMAKIDARGCASYTDIRAALATYEEG